MAYVYVDSARCTGCAACTKICPTGAIRVINGVAHIDRDRCDVCQACLGVCPNTAIVLAVDTAAERSLQPQMEWHTPDVVERVKPPAPSLKKKIVPLVGGTLFLLGKELIPRILPHFIEALDRGVAQRLASASSVSNDLDRSISRQSGGGHRFRGRRRGRSG